MSFAQGMKICFFVFLVNCSLISNSRISAEWFVLTLAGQRLDFHCANVRGYDDDDGDDDEPTWPIIQIRGNPLKYLVAPLGNSWEGREEFGARRREGGGVRSTQKCPPLHLHPSCWL